MHNALCLEGQIDGTVRRRHQHADDSHGDRIPVKQTDLSRHAKVSEEGHVKLARFLERDAPHNIAQRGAEKNTQQQIGSREDKVPKRLPHPIIDVTANLQRDSPEDQRPKNEEESQIIAGKGNPEEPRKGDKHNSPEGHEPYLVPRPERTNRRDHLPALGGCSGNNEMQESRAKVASVQRHIDDQGERQYRVPDLNHDVAPVRDEFRDPPGKERASQE